MRKETTEVKAASFKQSSEYEPLVLPSPIAFSPCILELDVGQYRLRKWVCQDFAAVAVPHMGRHIKQPRGECP